MSELCVSLNSRLPSLTCANWGRPAIRHIATTVRSPGPDDCTRRVFEGHRMWDTQYPTVIVERCNQELVNGSKHRTEVSFLRTFHNVETAWRT